MTFNADIITSISNYGDKRTEMSWELMWQAYATGQEVVKGKVTNVADYVRQAHKQIEVGGTEWNQSTVKNDIFSAARLARKFPTDAKFLAAINKYNDVDRHKKGGQRAARAIDSIGGAERALLPESESTATKPPTKAEREATVVAAITKAGLSKADMQAIVDGMK